MPMGPRRVLRLAALLLAVVAALLAWQWWAADASPGTTDGAPNAAGPGGSLAGGDRGGAPSGATASGSREQQLALWQQRYMRAEQIYNSYRDATRHPPGSRPIAEHPDQARPFDPIARDEPMRDASGRPVAGVHLRTTQEKVFLGAAESSKFTITATDPAGSPLPLVIHRAGARNLPDSRALVTIVHADVPFNDVGMAPDDQAGDGQYSGRLHPVAQGFAAHAGTIRLLVDVTAGGEPGVVAFDVVYVPEVAAEWAGVREALEDGSLNFYLGARVKTPGRYVVSARVQDADGVPFALLQFNDTVEAGPAEFRLSLAGVLVHDKQPRFPLRLVDVEGFLLKPDTFPDRVMLPRLHGQVHASGRYDAARFSNEEWRSDERARYLAEYRRDVQQALAQLERLRQR